MSLLVQFLAILTFACWLCREQDSRSFQFLELVYVFGVLKPILFVCVLFQVRKCKLGLPFKIESEKPGEVAREAVE